MKSVLTSLIFLLFILNGYSQKYFPFPDLDAIWSVNVDKYSLLGDTVINGKSYKKYYITHGDTNFTFEKAEYFAAIREDSDMRIWRVKKDSMNEKLLYDFSVGVGDTVIVYPISHFAIAWSDSFNIKISKIDSVQIFNVYRMRYHISTLLDEVLDPEYWIEGIGSTMGLFDSGISLLRVIDIGYPELLCFQLNDRVSFFGYNTQTCYRPSSVGIDYSISNKQSCYFYPNPAGSNTTLRFNNFTDSNYQLSVYSLTGLLISNYTIKSNDYVINRSEFNNGVYFYRLTSEQKIIKSGLLVFK